MPLIQVLVFMLAMGVCTLISAVGCMCMGSATLRMLKRRALGRSLLSSDMFNDREMQSIDWESKATAAGWAHDDGL